MHILRLILDICLLRGKVQDLPASVTLLVLAIFAGVSVDLVELAGNEFHVGHLLFLLAESALFGAMLWVMLRLRGFPARWLQTATALYAVSAVFNFVVLPFLPALTEMMSKGGEVAPNWQSYVVLGLSGWYLAVLARVLREAGEWSLGLSLVIGLVGILAVRSVSLLLAPLFGLHGVA
jgi:hypothetical protein